MDSFPNAGAFAGLERSVFAALETYSNVHRGRGHFSMATTHLYEQAREIVLEYLDLDKRKYVVIFCTASGAALLTAKLTPGSYTLVSGRDTGLSLGVTALAVKRKALTRETPFQAGGGTARLYSAGWVIWADPPDRFEAGTPAIINIIAFAKALRMVRQQGKSPFSLGPIADHPVADHPISDHPISDHSIPDRTARDILYHDDLEGYAGEELLTRLRPTLIGYNKVVPTTEGDKPFINLDNGASTPTFKPVWEVVYKTWRQPAEVQQEIIREARSVCAGFLGAPQESYDIIFTSGTTEAINLAADRLSHEDFGDTEPVILNTLLEHSSNDLPWRMIPGFSLIRLGVDEEGFLDVNELERLMYAYNQEGRHGKKRIRLVAMSGASNVLGSFNDLEEISRIVHKYSARLLVDAAQMVAHRTVNMEAAGIDYLVFSAHKMYAPFGTGALVVKKNIPGFSSAETELIRASGEENAVGIAALGKALILLKRIGMDIIREEEQILTKHALQELSKIPGLTLFGIKDPASPRIAQKGGVILLNLKGMMATQLASELALQGGIGTRSGCHCAHMMIKHLLSFTPTLEKFQRTIITLFPMITLPGLLRISLGIENTQADIDHLVSVLHNIRRKTPKKVKLQMKEFVLDVAERVYSTHPLLSQ